MPWTVNYTLLELSEGICFTFYKKSFKISKYTICLHHVKLAKNLISIYLLQTAENFRNIFLNEFLFKVKDIFITINQ